MSTARYPDSAADASSRTTAQSTPSAQRCRAGNASTGADAWCGAHGASIATARSSDARCQERSATGGPSGRPSLVSRALPAIALVALAACREVAAEGDTDADLADPDSLSDVLDLAWLRWADDADALAPAVRAMVALLDEDALATEHAEGEQRRFTEADLDVVDLHAPPDDDGSWSRPDPALARPVFLATRFACALDQLESVLIDLHQDELYADAYLAYERTYLTSDAAYLARTTDRLDWSVQTRSSYPTAGEFTEDILGGIRRLPLPDVDDADVGGDAWLLARTWIPFPAARDNDKIAFDQDYQLELYVPWGDGDIVHLYGLWRQLDTPFGDFEGDLVPRLTVTNLVKWDDQTAELCAAGL